MKQTHKNAKIKKSILIIAFILSTICIVFNYLNVFPLSNSQTFATQETKANIAEDMINNTNEESTLIEIESNQKEDTKVEIQLAEAEEEDGNIKTLLQNIQTENNLNDKNFSFFYYNIDKQKYYFYNENTYFTAASTVKVPIAMYHYDEIKNGNLTPKDKFLYTSDCYEKGNGTTNVTYSVGQSIPVNFLLKQSIVNSDNTATNILIKNLGTTKYRKDIAKYTTKELPKQFFEDNITSASYSYDVLNYLYEHIENYPELIDNMKQSSMGKYLKKYIDTYDVAHKYGSIDGYVHDYGIVFGKDTYLIGIFTKNIPNSDELIANISLKVLNYTLEP